MKIVLSRFDFSNLSTIGTLTVGPLHCYTLEDVDRYLEIDPDAKQFGKTAIPRGTYKVIIDYSNRFKRELPRLLDVPGFSGIRIHPGNGPDDTEGCILVGSSYKADWVGNSKATFTRVFEQIEHAFDSGENIELEVM